MHVADMFNNSILTAEGFNDFNCKESRNGEKPAPPNIPTDSQYSWYWCCRQTLCQKWVAWASIQEILPSLKLQNAPQQRRTLLHSWGCLDNLTCNLLHNHQNALMRCSRMRIKGKMRLITTPPDIADAYHEIREKLGAKSTNQRGKLSVSITLRTYTHDNHVVNEDD